MLKWVVWFRGVAVNAKMDALRKEGIPVNGNNKSALM